MGVVFHAYDRHMQREVAVKVLLFDGCRDEELQERFEREVKALAALDHQNIVKILSSGVNKDGNPTMSWNFSTVCRSLQK